MEGGAKTRRGEKKANKERKAHSCAASRLSVLRGKGDKKILQAVSQRACHRSHPQQKPKACVNRKKANPSPGKRRSAEEGRKKKLAGCAPATKTAFRNVLSERGEKLADRKDGTNSGETRQNLTTTSNSIIRTQRRKNCGKREDAVNQRGCGWAATSRLTLHCLLNAQAAIGASQGGSTKGTDGTSHYPERFLLS